MKQPYLFVFTIGPVQSFISQARKTKDLYYGSYILSYLSNEAIKELKSIMQENCEIIFPNEVSLNRFDILSIPNRFLAELRVENKEDIKSIAKMLEKKVRETFMQYGLKFIDSVSNPKEDTEEYKNQLNDLLEIFWAAIEKNNYHENYILLEKTLGAVKNIRGFKQIDERLGKRKCSICGQHNALVKQKKSEMKYEELCAVCWTKRNLDKVLKTQKGFPSTAKVAAYDGIYALEQEPEGKQLLEKYKEIFGDDFNDELLFEENVNKQFFTKYNLENYFKEETLQTFRDLNDFRKGHDINFSKYYAIVMLDGDNMGKWLSGANLESNTSLYDFHKNVSLKLVEYTNKVNDIITEPIGKVVYSGGDDVLALVNLKNLVDILRELRKEFPQFLDGKKITTASCGVCIAHYKTPLNQALEWAREAEHHAKEMYDKDALSIVILKHSGEITRCRFKWYSDQTKEESLAIIKDIQNRILNNILNTSLLFKIQESLRGIGDSISVNMFKTEVKRLIKRSLNQNLSEVETKKNTIEITDNLVKLYNLTHYKLSDVFNILDFIAFLVRGETND